MVSMSLRTPRWQVFLLIPKSMSLTVLLTGQQSIFQGLMSRWHMFRLCRYCKAWTSCLTTSCSCCSEERRVSLRLGLWKHSMTRKAQCWLRSRYSARYLIMLGCRSSFRLMKFLLRSRMCYSQNFIFFAAQSLPVFKCWHLQTQAFAPSPSFSNSLYFLEKALSPQSMRSSEFSDSLVWLSWMELPLPPLLLSSRWRASLFSRWVLFWVRRAMDFMDPLRRLMRSSRACLPQTGGMFYIKIIIGISAESSFSQELYNQFWPHPHKDRQHRPHTKTLADN